MPTPEHRPVAQGRIFGAGAESAARAIRPLVDLRARADFDGCGPCIFGFREQESARVNVLKLHGLFVHDELVNWHTVEVAMTGNDLLVMNVAQSGWEMIASIPQTIDLVSECRIQKHGRESGLEPFLGLLVRFVDWPYNVLIAGRPNSRTPVPILLFQSRSMFHHTKPRHSLRLCAQRTASQKDDPPTFHHADTSWFSRRPSPTTIRPYPIDRNR